MPQAGNVFTNLAVSLDASGASDSTRCTFMITGSTTRFRPLTLEARQATLMEHKIPLFKWVKGSSIIEPTRAPCSGSGTLASTKHIQNKSTQQTRNIHLNMKKILIAGITLAASMGPSLKASWSLAPIKAVLLPVWCSIFTALRFTTMERSRGIAACCGLPVFEAGIFLKARRRYTGTLIGGSTVGTGPTGWGNGNNYSADLVAAPVIMPLRVV